jgi:type IV pilus assembly protein PilA
LPSPFVCTVSFGLVRNGARGPNQQGMTLIELLIVIVILGVLFVLAVGAVRRARTAANEGSALSSLKLIGQAEVNFSAVCGRGGYTMSLVVLGQPPPSSQAGFLDGSLARDPAERSGFEFRVQKPGEAIVVTTADCHGAASYSRFYASGRPFDFGSSGNRSFAMTERGELWSVDAASPPNEPFGPPASLIK